MHANTQLQEEHDLEGLKPATPYLFLASHIYSLNKKKNREPQSKSFCWELIVREVRNGNLFAGVSAVLMGGSGDNFGNV